MSVSLALKIGTALGVGGLVYWGVTALFGAPAQAAPLPTTAKDSAKGSGAAPAPAPAPASDYDGISGTAEAGDDVSGVIKSPKQIQLDILNADRATVRPGYHVSTTETWRDPGDNSLYAIWFRDSDGIRGVFYDGVFHRME